jgi:hypothetical protein
MRYFEDDSHKIPDYIKNMPPEKLKKLIAKYDEQLRQERLVRERARGATVNA